LEPFQTKKELQSQFANPSMYGIKSKRKFVLHMVVAEEIKGDPGYFVIDVVKFWRAG
jgi:hypothetical protein